MQELQLEEINQVSGGVRLAMLGEGIGLMVIGGIALGVGGFALVTVGGIAMGLGGLWGGAAFAD